ncbi:hypothetical protein EXE43_20335, partial [Halorubrum sp. SS5]
SQFENHVRAVLGWPLGPTDLVAPAVTANVLGDVHESRALVSQPESQRDSGDVDEREAARLRNVETVLDAPDADLHWYGKDDVYPLRKMGHLTVTDRDVTDEVDPDALLSRARELRDGLTFRDA